MINAPPCLTYVWPLQSDCLPAVYLHCSSCWKGRGSHGTLASNVSKPLAWAAEQTSPTSAMFATFFLKPRSLLLIICGLPTIWVGLNFISLKWRTNHLLENIWISVCPVIGRKPCDCPNPAEMWTIWLENTFVMFFCCPAQAQKADVVLCSSSQRYLKAGLLSTISSFWCSWIRRSELSHRDWALGSSLHSG